MPDKPVNGFIIAAAAMLVVPAPAHAGDPTGLWLTQNRAAKVQIFHCGESICGTIAWLSQPIDAASGKPMTDKFNADLNLRRRPMIGVEIFHRLRRSGEADKWVGRIYNPEDGSTYDGSIELAGSAQLKVRGCVWIYCETESWTRNSEP